MPTLPELPLPVTPPVVVATTGIPDPDIASRLDPEQIFGRSRGTLGPSDEGGGSPNGGSGEPFPERFVDRAIVPLPGTPPRYPATLREAGLEGSVHVQFVVDTTGRVEPGSIRVLDATHDLFARTVRESLGRARFTPAEVAGRKVRQLAEQRFTFRIERD